MGWYSQAVEQGARSLGLFAHEGPEQWVVIGRSTLGAQYISGPYGRDEATVVARRHRATALMMHPPRVEGEDDER